MNVGAWRPMKQDEEIAIGYMIADGLREELNRTLREEMVCSQHLYICNIENRAEDGSVRPTRRHTGCQTRRKARRNPREVLLLVFVSPWYIILRRTTCTTVHACEAMRGLDGSGTSSW